MTYERDLEPLRPNWVRVPLALAIVGGFLGLVADFAGDDTELVLHGAALVLLFAALLVFFWAWGISKPWRRDGGVSPERQAETRRRRDLRPPS